MIDKLKDFLKTYLSGNKVPINVRVPEELHKLLEAKYKAMSPNFTKFEFADFIRIALSVEVMPELLKSELQNSNDWITQEGKECMELHFKNKVEKLQAIKEVAEYAIEKTSEFRDLITNAEVEYLNDVNTKISEELN